MGVAAGLPETTRRVLTLRKVYGLRPGAIAARLALTDAEVERHLIAAALACGRHFEEPPTACAGAYPDTRPAFDDPVHSE
jgi:DNA-directed RNA polymerase specialized sigma24 family protein